MTAVEDLKEGVLIKTSRPYLYQLSSQFLTSHCSQCLYKKETLRKCSACSWVQYCGQTCHKIAWKIHKYECNLIKKAINNNPKSPTIPSDSVLFLYKLYCHSQSSKGQKVVDTFMGVDRSFKDLMTHKEELKLDPNRMQKFYDAYVQLKCFVKLDERGDGSLNEDLLLETFGKMVINSYSILDEDLNDVATGLYLGPSLLDHSCRANCVCIFNGCNLKLKTITSIMKGEKLTISYIDVMDTTSNRRTELVNNYYFICDCASCLDSDRDDQMVQIKYSMSEDEDEKERLKGKLDKDFKIFNEKSKDVDYHELYTLAKEFEKTWHNILSDRNIYLFHVLSHLYESCIVLQKWSEAVTIGEKISKFYHHYIPHPLPNYVFHLLKLAKIYLYLHENLRALQILEEVRPLVCVLFDSQDVIFTRFNQLFQQCTQELNVN